MPDRTTKPLAERLLNWWDQHGRKQLPWQRLPRDAYHIWVAEIMLQQTQVTTVIPYYLRFLERFPTLTTLAGSSIDDVLAHWSGLGYYQRARNLHRCAVECADRYQACLPMHPDDLIELPGIGKSTANAIISQSTDTVLPILDGNVKRWLARYAGISGWPGKSAVSQNLWQAAERYLPLERGADYTQAGMDLGALVCRRSKPDCQACPLNYDCFALHNNRIAELPGKKPKRAVPTKVVHLLVHQHNDEILLEKRPPAGIWGGLWCLPMVPDTPQDGVLSEERYHQLSHFRMHIKLWVQTVDKTVMDSRWQWHSVKAAQKLGLPKPIRDVVSDLLNP